MTAKVTIIRTYSHYVSLIVVLLAGIALIAELLPEVEAKPIVILLLGITIMLGLSRFIFDQLNQSKPSD
jgi:hypothetical protein